MGEMTVSEAKQNFSQLIAAAERGETIIITRNGSPVAKIAPLVADRTSAREWRRALEALRNSLRSKPPTGYRVGKIAEGDKYGFNAV